MHGADRNAITAGPQPPNSRSRRRTIAAEGPLPPIGRSRAFTCPGRTRSNRSSFFRNKELECSGVQRAGKEPAAGRRNGQTIRTTADRRITTRQQSGGIPTDGGGEKAGREKKRTGNPNDGGSAGRYETTVQRQTDGWRRREGGPERKPGRMTHDTQVRAAPRNALIQTREPDLDPRTK